jgi:Flp pilus assembly protein TadD
VPDDPDIPPSSSAAPSSAPASSGANPLFRAAAQQYSRGDIVAAIDSLRRGLAIDATDAVQWYNLGALLASRGAFTEAEAAVRKSLEIRPDFAEAYSELAGIFTRRGDLAAAEQVFRRALSLQPRNAAAHNGLGVVLQTLGRPREAADALARAIAIDPTHAEAHANLAAVRAVLGQVEAAHASFHRAVALRPNMLGTFQAFGSALFEGGYYDEAAGVLREALRISPNDAALHSNVATALRSAGKLDEARAEYERAIALDPSRPDVRLNYAIGLLLAGDFERGLVEYESRLKLAPLSALQRELGSPRWTGEPAPGKTILLRHEQGLGDTIQMIRFAPQVADRSERVVVVAPAALVQLMRKAPGVSDVVSIDALRPPHDLWCPMMSLPHVLGIRANNIPAPVPYLSVDPAAVEMWRARLASTVSTDALRIGIAWAGSHEHRRDRLRSAPLSHFANLSQMPKVALYNLQFGSPAAAVQESPLAGRLTDDTRELNNFADTAAYLMNLDLVITVDTATAHLAGALGRPVWTLLDAAPDWRWMLHRTGSPWYPTMRLFRQPRPGAWDELFREVEDSITDLISNREATS